MGTVCVASCCAIPQMSSQGCSCVLHQAAHLGPSPRAPRNSQEGEGEGITDWGAWWFWTFSSFFLLGQEPETKTVPSLMTSEYSKFCLDTTLDHLKVLETISASVLKQRSGKLTLHNAPHEYNFFRI